ncbi:class I SAM-dependent methyltransferase [Roseiconus lacunae]|uniref:class I SAM-dependent methyltransferase n=1 Tax=Roseiconus lacunae TaxID=2605694 RepID=UPI001E4D6A1D|nr:class I SAM-dependent methyltransferase [Roseiconus lacunae]MCD0461141.1 class I SAM-dependent methyltransferase [Roseiconus lacunae]
MLTPIELPSHINTRPVDSAIAKKLRQMHQRIEVFQDCWNQHHAAQFVAADYELVYQTLTWLLEKHRPINRGFLEWGCGFATVACLADSLGLASYGVESHPDLIVQARQTISDWPATVELFHGDFLPPGAEDLAFDSTLPSVGHSGENPYEIWGVDLDDFGLVYSYPWPGEDQFHEDVFDRYAANEAMLLMFIGPNEMRAWRKSSR